MRVRKRLGQPGFHQCPGKKGWMRADGKPNVPEKLTIQTLDQGNPSVSTDAAGATVRKSIVKDYLPPAVRHRMTQEFADFAEIIDGRENAVAAELMEETIQVVKVLEMAGMQDHMRS